MSPALAGGLLTTEPPGKPLFLIYFSSIFFRLFIWLCWVLGAALGLRSFGVWA